MSWTCDQIILRAVDDVNLAVRMRKPEKERWEDGHWVVLICYKGDADLRSEFINIELIQIISRLTSESRKSAHALFPPRGSAKVVTTTSTDGSTAPLIIAADMVARAAPIHSKW